MYFRGDRNVVESCLRNTVNALKTLKRLNGEFYGI